MSSGAPKTPPMVAGKFKIEAKLGAGCFGEVYRGQNTETKEVVAVKFEDSTGHALQLQHEAEVLRQLAKPVQPQGFEECFYYGVEQRFHCLVMEILGESLEERLQASGGKFNAQTATLVAEQVLHRIEYLHSKAIVHRDIKPENFMFGIKNKIHHLYLIDFGLSKKYFDQKHVGMRTQLSLIGTATYASINAHRGVEQSRRDDLEAIGHMFMYFLRGALPWSGLDAKTQEEKYRKIRDFKESVPLGELCLDHPKAFQTYLSNARDLDFKERPDYKMLRGLFADLRAANGPPEDHGFQFLEGKDLGALEPLEYPTALKQPDDEAPKRGFCFCGGKPAVRD